MLRTPDVLHVFCEQLDLPHVELPEWYTFYFPPGNKAPSLTQPITESSTPEIPQTKGRPTLTECLLIPSRPLPAQSGLTLIAIHEEEPPCCLESSLSIQPWTSTCM